jgi:hypothetical protein
LEKTVERSRITQKPCQRQTIQRHKRFLIVLFSFFLSLGG